MMEAFVFVARLALAAVFAASGLAKLADAAGTRKSLMEFGVPSGATPVLALLLPLAELTCVVMLVPAAWAPYGAAGTLALLALFTAAIAVNLAHGRKPDCHCFGQLHSEPVGAATIVRNVVLAAMAASVLWLGPGLGAREGFQVFTGSVGADHGRPVLLLFIVVIVQLVVGAVVIYQLLRQNGRILNRLDALEARLASGNASADDPKPLGLSIGTPAPSFSLAALDGSTVTFEALPQSGRSLLLLFTEPGCTACDELLPDVGRWQREHAERVMVVPISRGGAAGNRTKAHTHGIQHMLLQKDREVAEAYLVDATPSAVLVTDGAIASSLSVGGDAIRELVTDAAMPPPLKKGEAVTSLTLRELGGGQTDLAELKGRRRLLLFWSPTCGFCTTMLDDVKAWEQSNGPEAPELIVISNGSPKANRDQGFRSRVLLDAHFTAGARFGAGGTPAAVLIDEDGRVASDVSVGGPRVMELAGAVATTEAVGQ